MRKGKKPISKAEKCENPGEKEGKTNRAEKKSKEPSGDL